MREETFNRVRSAALIVVVILFLAWLTSLAGCAGNHTRDHVLTPAIQLAMDGVADNVRYGMDNAYGDNDIAEQEWRQLENNLTAFEAAVDSGDREQILGETDHWPTFYGYGQRGIQALVDDGRIGSGVAVSLFERLQNFDEAIHLLTQE